MLVARPLNEESSKYLEAFKLAATETAEHVAKYVREQLSVNFLQLQLLTKSHERVSDVFLDKSRECLEEIHNGFPSPLPAIAFQEDGFLGRSRLMYFIYLCASAVFYPEIAGWDQTKKKSLLLAQLHKNGEQLRLMPYDPERVALFIRVATDSINSTSDTDVTDT